jgi:hypothetical protein
MIPVAVGVWIASGHTDMSRAVIPRKLAQRIALRSAKT